MNDYIIIGCARSGTTVTHLALKGHPNVYALNDEIRIPPFFLNPLSLVTFGNNTKAETELFLPLFFNLVTSINPEGKNIQAKGLKTAVAFPGDAALFVEKVQKYLPHVHIIFVNRKDYVAQYASLVRAAKTGQYHSWGKAKKQINRIRLNKFRYYSYLLDCLETRDNIHRLKKTHRFCEFLYEEDITNRNYSKIFNFLEIEDISPSWLRSEKIAPNPEDFIVNYFELGKKTKEIIGKYEIGANLNFIWQIRRCILLGRKLKNHLLGRLSGKS